MMNGPDDFIGPVNLGNPGEFTIRELAEAGDRTDGQQIEDRPPAAAGRRSDAAAAGHHAGPQEARRLGAEGAAPRRAAEDDRLVPLDRVGRLPGADAELLSRQADLRATCVLRWSLAADPRARSPSDSSCSSGTSSLVLHDELARCVDQEQHDRVRPVVFEEALEREIAGELRLFHAGPGRVAIGEQFVSRIAAKQRAAPAVGGHAIAALVIRLGGRQADRRRPGRTAPRIPSRRAC